jgi:hypothetical protein
MEKYNLTEEILDIIDSENSGLSHEKRIEEIRKLLSEKENNPKLVGYIIYDFYIFKTKSPHETEWKNLVSGPEISWKKKIYRDLRSVNEAISHMEKSGSRKGIPVPIYANREDLGLVTKTYKALKNKIEDE